MELRTIENVREPSGNGIVGDVKYEEVVEVTNSGRNFLGDPLPLE